MRKIVVLALLVAAAAAVAVTRGPSPQSGEAASHREAPLISQDPTADVTDFYFFTSPDGPDTVTAIMNVIPFEDPSGGPNWYSFSTSAKYVIHFDNNGDGKPDVSYEFRFKDAKASLSDTLPLGCIAGKCQNYNVWRVKGGKGTGARVGKNLPVAPNNIGPRTRGAFEGGADYAAIRARTIKGLKGGGLVFAGQADDPFFVDLGAAFDALGFRSGTGNKGGGKDALAGYNVHTIAIQIPKSAIKGKTDVVGAWAAVYREKETVRTTYGGEDNWVQVSRLGNPLVNELLIPTAKKDEWNGVGPDRDSRYVKYIRKPAIAAVANQLYAALNLNIPEDNRTDLVAAVLNGLDLLGNKTGTTFADEVRLNLSTPPAATPNRLGPLGGDLAGWPNGRRLADDVTDIALIAVGGALFTPPNVLPLGDGVDANDLPFGSSFPYVALPHEGFANSKGVLQATTP